jgi:hypothetical protein
MAASIGIVEQRLGPASARSPSTMWASTPTASSSSRAYNASNSYNPFQSINPFQSFNAI